MTASRWGRRSHRAAAARVALVAAALVALLYVALAVTFDVADSHRLVGEVDTHLKAALSRASSPTVVGPALLPPISPDNDLDGPPIILWRVQPDGHVRALSNGAPPLPAGSWSRSGRATTAEVGTSTFLFLASRSARGWTVAGQSLVDAQHVASTLATAEVIAGPVFVVAMFLAAFVIGLEASGPIEQSRRRQLEFTADASHELRTPLSVIEAEVDLALSTPRQAPAYREALERIGTESRRLHRIVEDLLWLARVDSAPPTPGDEPVDLPAIAEQGVQRFLPVARAKGLALSARTDGDDHGLINAPSELVDRLAGVLIDNAVRYTPPGGAVEVGVVTSGNRVSLVVTDNGPGIPAEERPYLFDRFRRATTDQDGTGLGLAIADSVVRSTGGRWRVADAPGGGAHVEVSWHRHHPREPQPTHARAAPAAGT